MIKMAIEKHQSNPTPEEGCSPDSQQNENSRIIVENSIVNTNIERPGEYVTVPELMEYVRELYSHHAVMLQDVLFLDTESDPKTKKPRTIQMLMNGEIEIINHPKKYKLLKEWMTKAKVVVIYNAPYDLGVLSIWYKNKNNWQEDKWHFKIEGFFYEVRRLGIGTNYIKSHGKAPKVFDMQKLWNLLVSNGVRKLEDIVWDEFKVKMIPWSDENSKTEAYQLQDVVLLAKTYVRFFERTADIEEIAGYTPEQWERICTQASFPKNEYLKVYPLLPEWRKHNLSENARLKLKYAFEEAYNGGITCALYRGIIPDSVWSDVHGMYAHVMAFENTDQYKLYELKEIEPPKELTRDNKPLLCRIKTDAVIMKIADSLKMFRLRYKGKRWVMSYDVLALRLIFPDADIEIIEAVEPIPLNPVSESLPKKWSDRKEELQAKKGKTPRVMLYKFMSNTSYGITAQRKPWDTEHTNELIASIITSRAHLVLAEMIDEARKMGTIWCYSDTDSICVKLNGADPVELDKRLNERIAPYTCECEFIGKTRILSLKRYIAYDGVDLKGNPVKDKIRLHGKSVYNITEEDVLNMLNGKINYEPLLIKQMTANTPRSMKRIMTLCPKITHPHPFMFVKDVPDPRGRSKQDWFEQTYLPHIDNKLDTPENTCVNDNFMRNFFWFNDLMQARLFYGDETRAGDKDPDELLNREYIDWDSLVDQIS